MFSHRKFIRAPDAGALSLAQQGLKWRGQLFLRPLSMPPMIVLLLLARHALPDRRVHVVHLTRRCGRPSLRFVRSSSRGAPRAIVWTSLRPSQISSSATNPATFFRQCFGFWLSLSPPRLLLPKMAPSDHTSSAIAASFPLLKPISNTMPRRPPPSPIVDLIKSIVEPSRCSSATSSSSAPHSATS